MRDPHCPRCPKGTRLVERQLKGANIEICEICHGVLMQRTDVDAMLAIAGRKAKKHGSAKSYFKSLHSSAQFTHPSPSISCPDCHYDMYEVSSYGLVIDFCLNCQHLWFDHGELKTALRKAKEEGIVDFVPSSIEESDTVALIGWMLETMAPE